MTRAEDPASQREAGAGPPGEIRVVIVAADHGIAEYADVIDDWVSRLRGASEIAQVDAGIADGSRNFSWLADRELLLLGGGSLESALHHLSPKGLAASVASRRTSSSRCWGRPWSRRRSLSNSNAAAIMLTNPTVIWGVDFAAGCPPERRRQPRLTAASL